jgi:hypothetical protein
VLTALSLVIERKPRRVRSRVIQKAGIVRGTMEFQAVRIFLDWPGSEVLKECEMSVDKYA